MNDYWNTDASMKYVLQKFEDKIEVTSKIVEDSAALLCPVDLGNLRASINHRVETNNDIVDGIIGTPVEYAVYIEFGTGEKAENGQGRKGGWFYINDRKQAKGFLVGMTKEGKYLYFTFGNKPYPFLRPALYNNKQDIERLLAT